MKYVCLSVCLSVCASVCLSVCPYVCLITRSRRAAAAGLLLSAVPAKISIDSGGCPALSSSRAAAYAGSTTLSAGVRSWTQICCWSGSATRSFKTIVSHRVDSELYLRSWVWVGENNYDTRWVELAHLLWVWSGLVVKTIHVHLWLWTVGKLLFPRRWLIPPHRTNDYW